MAKLTPLGKTIKALSSGAGSISLPTLTSLRLSMPASGTPSRGARQFAKVLLPKLKYANPGVRVEVQQWKVRKPASEAQIEEMNEEQREEEKAAVEAEEKLKAQRKSVMNVDFVGMPSREIQLADKRELDILSELQTMANFTEKDQAASDTSVTPVPPVLPKATADAVAARVSS